MLKAVDGPEATRKVTPDRLQSPGSNEATKMSRKGTWNPTKNSTSPKGERPKLAKGSGQLSNLLGYRLRPWKPFQVSGRQNTPRR